MEYPKVNIKRIQLLLVVVLGFGLLGFLIFARQRTDNRSKASTNPSQEVEAGLLTGNVNIGSDAAASGGQYVVFGQSAVAAPTNTLVPPVSQDTSGHALLGVSPNVWDMLGSQAFVDSLLKYNFKFIGSLNAMKMDATEPQRGVFDFGQGDYEVQFAQAHGMLVHGHTLILDSDQLPKWLTDGYNNGQISNADMRAIMENHIKTVVGHFKGRVYSWDVVNELYGTTNIWSKSVGPDYFKLAFQWAHDADPQAKLCYNDQGAETLGITSDNLLAGLKALKAQGIPINCVGFETHIGRQFGYPNADSMQQNLQRFGDAGFEVTVSEIDVMEGSVDLTSAQLQDQASRFSSIAAACYAVTACKRFTISGFSDKDNWYTAIDSPTPFDRNYQPKPAWYSIKSALHI